MTIDELQTKMRTAGDQFLAEYEAALRKLARENVALSDLAEEAGHDMQQIADIFIAECDRRATLESKVNWDVVADVQSGRIEHERQQ